MGTRGLYVFRWRGRYYVYHNQWDSYPRGLGNTLVSMVPSDAQEHRSWLEAKRREYSSIEDKLAPLYALSWSQAENVKTTPIAATGVEWLHGLPSYKQPSRDDLSVEYVYIIDLDREVFTVNELQHIPLANLPRDLDCIGDSKLLSGAFDDSKPPEERCKDTATIAPNAQTPGTIELDPQAEYTRLKPRMIEPKRTSVLNRKPSFVVCEEIFTVMLRWATHRATVWQAQCAGDASDFLFREVAFVLVSLASCSTESLRFGYRSHVTEQSPEALFATLRLTCSEPEIQPVFASELAAGFHLQGQQAGTAPHASSYWLHDVLVYLCCELIHHESYIKAIVNTVRIGRAEGQTRFHAITTSIAHAILIRVTEDGVWHSKRLNFAPKEHPYWVRSDSDNDTEEKETASVSCPGEDVPFIEQPQPITLAAISESPKSGPEAPCAVRSGKLAISAWVDDEDEACSFAAIAHLFEAAILQKLRPSSSHSHGVFPNEIYELIISYADEATRKSCLLVSRAFREYASEVLGFSDRVVFERDSRKSGLRLRDIITGNTGSLKFHCRWAERECCSDWLPVIDSKQGTASIIPSMFICNTTALELVEGNEGESHEDYGDYEEHDEEDYEQDYAEDYAETYEYDYEAADEETHEEMDEDNLSKDGNTSEIYGGERDGDSGLSSAPGENLPTHSFLDPEEVYKAWEKHKYEIHRTDERTATFDYELLERLLPSQNVIAASADVATLYLIVFFNKLRIFGCSMNEVNTGAPMFRERKMCEIPKLPINTFSLLPCRRDTTYALLWSKQPKEDTPAGWQSAMQEAIARASEEYRKSCYIAWLKGHDCKNMDFAIVVVIGLRLKILHRATFPDIPRIDDCPRIRERVKNSHIPHWQYVRQGRMGDFVLWDNFGIHYEDGHIDGWVAVNEMKEGNAEGVLDTMDPAHRPVIGNVFRWIVDLASQHGEAHKERLADIPFR